MTTSPLILAKAQVSHHLSRRLRYYLTLDEVHRLTDAAENERDRLFLRLLWETRPTSQRGHTRQTSSPSEKHGWRVFGGMMGPVQ